MAASRACKPSISPLLEPPGNCDFEPMLQTALRAGLARHTRAAERETPTHTPISPVLWQQHACRQLDHSQGANDLQEVRAVHADAPAPCRPMTPAANKRPHLAAWLRASRCAESDYRSITSPMASLPSRNR